MRAGATWVLNTSLWHHPAPLWEPQYPTHNPSFPQLLLTVPAAQGTSVCSKSPEMRTPSPAGPPLHWGWRGPWHLGWQGRENRRTNQVRTSVEMLPTRCPFGTPPTCPSPAAWQGKKGTSGLWDGQREIHQWMCLCVFFLVSWRFPG